MSPKEWRRKGDDAQSMANSGDGNERVNVSRVVDVPSPIFGWLLMGFSYTEQDRCNDLRGQVLKRAFRIAVYVIIPMNCADYGERRGWRADIIANHGETMNSRWRAPAIHDVVARVCAHPAVGKVLPDDCRSDAAIG